MLSIVIQVATGLRCSTAHENVPQALVFSSCSAFIAEMGKMWTVVSAYATVLMERWGSSYAFTAGLKKHSSACDRPVIKSDMPTATSTSWRK